MLRVGLCFVVDLRGRGDCRGKSLGRGVRVKEYGHAELDGLVGLDGYVEWLVLVYWEGI